MEHTQPTRPLDVLQPIRVNPISLHKNNRSKRSPRMLLFMLLIVLIYLFAPFRTNILLLGTDDSPGRGSLGRTDSILLTTIVPFKPYIGILSIPRDLWVFIPGVGEQRINTAYFFAEAENAGSGTKAAMETIKANFNVNVAYYMLIRMTGLVESIDALGGVDIRLETFMGGYEPGVHHLDGADALAFVRERATGSDFARMQRGQILLTAILDKLFNLSNLPQLPSFALSLTRVIDTNIPMWQWPRLIVALLRAFLIGLDSRTITPDMVIPFQTSGGAQVLAPKWEEINPVIVDMFGR
ncbi:MAG: LCP family protein [Anaerolineales bacterium]|nr:LCP family protein [Anaerolineales bacterium]